MSYIFRKADIDDARFLSKVIIEAERSGSDKIGLANIFDLSEGELENYLVEILEEEIDGCEFSISSFVVGEYEQTPVAAFCGWIEGENEDDQLSAILKSNLIGFVFPNEALMASKDKQEFLRDLQIDREAHAHQLEYAFVDLHHRGHSLINKITEELIQLAKRQNPDVKKSQVQVFENNIRAIKVYERSGYKIVKRCESTHSETLDYLPWNVKLVMEKEL